MPQSLKFFSRLINTVHVSACYVAPTPTGFLQLPPLLWRAIGLMGEQNF